MRPASASPSLRAQSASDDVLLHIDQLPFPAWLSRRSDGAIVRVNPAFERTFGWSAGEAEGRMAGELRLLEGADAAPHQARAQAGEPAQSVRVQLRSKPGSVQPALVSSLPWDDGASTLEVAVLLPDEQRLEDKLQESEERYRIMVEQVQDYAIFLLDPEGRVQTWNLGAQRLKGYAAHEIVGQSFEAFYTQADRLSGVPRRLLEAAAREGHATYEGWRLRKDGSRFWADMALTAIRRDGRLIGFTKVTRDATDRKERDEAELRVYEQGLEMAKLRELAAMKTAFVNVSAHELLTPLTPMMTAMHLLTEHEGMPAAQRAHYMQLLKRNLERLQRLVNDLLEISRLESGAMAIHRRQVDLAALAEQARALFAMQAQARGIQVRVDSPEPVLAAVDPDRVSQVLTNLVANAVKFTPDGGEVTIKVGRAAGSAILEVQDTGPGLDPVFLPRMFQPFSRASGHGKPGTGLGLYVCKGLVELHGGTIEGGNASDGRGAVFRAILPLGDAAQKAQAGMPRIKVETGRPAAG